MVVFVSMVSPLRAAESEEVFYLWTNKLRSVIRIGALFANNSALMNIAREKRHSNYDEARDISRLQLLLINYIGWPCKLVCELGATCLIEMDWKLINCNGWDCFYLSNNNWSAFPFPNYNNLPVILFAFHFPFCFLFNLFSPSSFGPRGCVYPSL